MPRNRRPRDREEKRAEIIAAARGLFTDDGYEAVSMARIARTAGVASNTVYWYFAGKDEVLIAVLDEMLGESLARLEHVQSHSRADRLRWVIDELAQSGRLVSTVHGRSRESESVNTWHREFHTLTETVLRVEFADMGVPESDLDAVVTIAVFVLEGLLMHPEQAPAPAAVIETLLRSVERLGSAPGDA